MNTTIKLFDVLKAKMPKLPKQSRKGDFVTAVAFDATDWHEHWTALFHYKDDDFFGGDYWHLNDAGELTGGTIGNVSLRESRLYWFDTFKEAKRFRNLIELYDKIDRLYEELEEMEKEGEANIQYYRASGTLRAFKYAVTRP